MSWDSLQSQSVVFFLKDRKKLTGSVKLFITDTSRKQFKEKNDENNKKVLQKFTESLVFTYGKFHRKIIFCYNLHHISLFKLFPKLFSHSFNFTISIVYKVKESNTKMAKYKTEFYFSFAWNKSRGGYSRA